MKLNTKKNGGIVLHADESRAITKAQSVMLAVEKHGNEAQSKAARQAIEAVVALWHALAGANQ